MAIADCASDDGTNAWPSLATLAKKTRLDERTVRRILWRLEEGGHIKVEVGAGPYGTNRYTVLMGQCAPGQNAPGQNAPGQIAPGQRGPSLRHSYAPERPGTAIERPMAEPALARAP